MGKNRFIDKYGKPNGERKVSAHTKMSEAYNEASLEKSLSAISESATMNQQRTASMNTAGSKMVGSRATLRKHMIAEKVKFETELKENLFLESIYDIYLESLLLDDEFIEGYSENLRSLFMDTTKQLFAENNINMKELGESSCVYIKDIISLCEDVAKEQADKIFDLSKTKTQEGKEQILNEKDKKKEAELSDEDKKDFDKKKEAETEAISTAVKEKVVDVVRKEQKAAEKSENDKDELETETDEEVMDAKEDMEEDQEKAKAKKSDDKDEDGADEDKADESEELDDVKWGKQAKKGKKSDEDDDIEVEDLAEAAKLERNDIRIPNKLAEESLFRSLQINISNKMIKESTENGLSESETVLDMDLVLAESLAIYTLLETLHTARIVEFDAKKVRSLSKELLYTK